jgi:hypothetical protein
MERCRDSSRLSHNGAVHSFEEIFYHHRDARPSAHYAADDFAEIANFGAFGEFGEFTRFM